MILFRWDSEATVYTVNKDRSRCLLIMKRIKSLTLNARKNYICFRDKHIPEVQNNINDSRSR